VISPLKREITRALHVIDRSWAQLFDWTRMGIGRRDLVLDVGSGGHPFGRADVLCDKFLFDNIERQGQESLVVDRPLVVADATKLPFRDGAFDFSRTSHLLEHLDEPEQHLAELQRVSRRGIIITPSEAWERLYPISSHRWVVNEIDSKLTLREKPRPIFDEDVGRIFHSLERYGLSYFLDYFRNVFEVHYRWDGAINFSVERLPEGQLNRLSGKTDAAAAAAPASEAPPESTKRSLKMLASKVTRRLCSSHYGLDIWSLVVCPQCRGSLERGANDCRCAGCHRTYRIQRDIPILLLE
jgi:SAM-dependent methyltransferase